jgi:hypothetical protein
VLVPPQSFYLRILGAPWNHAWNVEAHERLTILLGDRPELIDGFLGSANGDAFFDSTRDPAERGHRHLNERGYARLAVRIARRLLHDGVFATGPAASRLPTGTREDEHGSNAFRRR